MGSETDPNKKKVERMDNFNNMEIVFNDDNEEKPDDSDNPKDDPEDNSEESSEEPSSSEFNEEETPEQREERYKKESKPATKFGAKVPAFQSTLYLTARQKTRRNSVSIRALDTLKPRTQGTLVEGRAAQLKALVIEADSLDAEFKIESMSLAKLLGKITSYIQQVNAKKPSPESSASDVLRGDHVGIPELRGRDLCRLTKFGKEMDIPVFLCRQHAIILSIRYDMRAIIQANRVILVAHQNDDNDLVALARHMKEFIGPRVSRKDNKTISSKVPFTNDSGSSEGTAKAVSDTTPTAAAAITSSTIANSVPQPGVLRGLSFEIKCIEALLTAVVAVHREEYGKFKSSCKTFLSALDSKFSGSLLTTGQQEMLRNLKEGVNDTLKRIKQCSTLLSDLLEDDKEMSLLNLTSFAEKPDAYDRFNAAPSSAEALKFLSAFLKERKVAQEDVEFLLEFHLIECQELENSIVSVIYKLEHAEESILVRLNVSQNELLIANTVVTIIACSIGFGGYVAGLFGMNLDNSLFLLPVKGSFYVVTGVSLAFIFTAVTVSIIYLRATGVLPRHVQLSGVATSYISSVVSSGTSRGVSPRDSVNNSPDLSKLRKKQSLCSRCGDCVWRRSARDYSAKIAVDEE